MVHRKIRENETSVILRNVTTYDIGIEFDVANAILANFSDNIKVTHKGKYLQVKLHSVLKIYV